MIGYYFGSPIKLCKYAFFSLLLISSALAESQNATDDVTKEKILRLEQLHTKIYQLELLAAKSLSSMEQNPSSNSLRISWLQAKNELGQAQENLSNFLKAEKNTEWPSFLYNAKNKGQNTAGALAYLLEQHKEASSYSSLEWKTIQAVYGQESYAAFLKKVFSVREIQKLEPATIFTNKDSFEIVFISLPTSKELLKEQKTRDFFQGHPFSEFVVSSYSSLEEQAEEVSHFLQSREGSDRSFILISAEESSGVLRKYFDLHPGSRKHPLIKAWINFNGKLFGEKLPDKIFAQLKNAGQRSPASASPIASNPQELEEYRRLTENQSDRYNRVLKFPAGFPIYTILSKEKAHDIDMHESFLADSENILLTNTVGTLSAETILSEWIPNTATESKRAPASRPEKIHQ